MQELSAEAEQLLYDENVPELEAAKRRRVALDLREVLAVRFHATAEEVEKARDQFHASVKAAVGTFNNLGGRFLFNLELNHVLRSITDASGVDVTPDMRKAAKTNPHVVRANDFEVRTPVTWGSGRSADAGYIHILKQIQEAHAPLVSLVEQRAELFEAEEPEPDQPALEPAPRTAFPAGLGAEPSWLQPQQPGQNGMGVSDHGRDVIGMPTKPAKKPESHPRRLAMMTDTPGRKRLTDEPLLTPP